MAALPPEPVKFTAPPMMPAASPAVSLLPDRVKALAPDPASTVPEVRAAATPVPVTVTLSLVLLPPLTVSVDPFSASLRLLAPRLIAPWEAVRLMLVPCRL